MSDELHLVVVHEEQVPTYLDKGYWVHDRPLSSVMNEKVLELLTREERDALRLMAIDRKSYEEQNAPPRRFQVVWTAQNMVDDADVHAIDLLEKIPPHPGWVVVNDRTNDQTYSANPNELHLTAAEAIRASAGSARFHIARHRQAIERLEEFLRRAEAE